MATQTILNNATRTNTTIESPDVASPANITSALFEVVGTNWTDPANQVRLEIWEAADGVTWEFSAGMDIPGGFVPRPGHNPNPSLLFSAFGYPRAQFPNARIKGRCVVTGTVRFRIDLTTTP